MIELMQPNIVPSVKDTGC